MWISIFKSLGITTKDTRSSEMLAVCIINKFRFNINYKKRSHFIQNDSRGVMDTRLKLGTK